jgi:tetratricopeptide (TPR) repeat protein
MRYLVVALLLAGGCGALSSAHQADAAFRNGLAAQLAGDHDRAEAEYQRILTLGFDWSPAWNNLAVLAARRHELIRARKLLAHAVAANERDVVALTNYGVISFYLADLREARRTLEDARALRRKLIARIPSLGRTNWDEDHYARVTLPLDEVAARYLDRIARAEVTDVAPPPDALVAERDLPIRF